MTGDPRYDALLKRYLLGELSGKDCDKVERDCLDDDNIFEQLEAIEAELTDDYVRGVLGRRRRKEFERRVLMAQGGQGYVEFSEMMIGSGVRRRPRISRLKAWMALAAALTFLIGLGWFTLGRWSPQPPRKQLASSSPPKKETAKAPPNTASTAAPTSATPQPPTAGAKAPFIATFVLISGGVRGEGEANEIRIPPNAKDVRFRIDLLSNEYSSYDASLNRVEGERLFVRSHLKARGSKSRATLFVELPASILPSGTSVLTLMGDGNVSSPEPVGKYVIRVLAH